MNGKEAKGKGKGGRGGRLPSHVGEHMGDFRDEERERSIYRILQNNIYLFIVCLTTCFPALKLLVSTIRELNFVIENRFVKRYIHVCRIVT
jgi:hypothetical protein